MGTAPTPALSPGAPFGKYVIVRQLAAGGMGAVYEAFHRDLHKRVALKVMLADTAREPDAHARFLREGQAAAQIRHPHIVDVTDMGAEGGVAFLVMEFLDGEDLASLLARQGRLPPAGLADLLLPILSAISAAHAMGILHRDLKPQNIVIARMGPDDLRPKVVDFGISKGQDPGVDLTGNMLIGTPAYMSPEQAQGKPLDARSDQYALGSILYECATGTMPYHAASIPEMLRRVAAGVFPPPRVHVPALPERLERIILRAMAPRPADRYPSVKELGLALLEFAGQRTRLVWEASFRDMGEEHTRQHGYPTSSLGDALGLADTAPGQPVTEPATPPFAAVPAPPAPVFRSVHALPPPAPPPRRVTAEAPRPEPLSPLMRFAASPVQVRGVRLGSRLDWAIVGMLAVVLVLAAVAFPQRATVAAPAAIRPPLPSPSPPPVRVAYPPPRASWGVANVRLLLVDKADPARFVPAKVTVDDEPPVQVDEPWLLHLAPGKHQVAVRSAAGALAVASVDLEVGDNPDVRLALEPKPAP